jgi:hypothetical protein
MIRIITRRYYQTDYSISDVNSPTVLLTATLFIYDSTMNLIGKSQNTGTVDEEVYLSSVSGGKYYVLVKNPLAIPSMFPICLYTNCTNRTSFSKLA